MKKINNKKLLIAGDGPDKDEIKEYIQKNNLQGRIKLLGYLNSNQVKEYVRKSRVVIVPSICRENCPYSILETLAIGRPIIGSNLGGIPELVINNECGYIYDNAEELTEKLEKILNDESIAKKMGDTSRKMAIEKFSKDAYYNRIINVYENIKNEEGKNKKFYEE